eukprot:8388495-Pyramimonas_sp.AAC.1
MILRTRVRATVGLAIENIHYDAGDVTIYLLVVPHGVNTHWANTRPEDHRVGPPNPRTPEGGWGRERPRKAEG